MVHLLVPPNPLAAVVGPQQVIISFISLISAHLAWDDSENVIDLDAYRKPTSSASYAEKETFNTTLRKIAAKHLKGELIVAPGLLQELINVLYESEMGPIAMEDLKYVYGWKTCYFDCPNFSQYLVQMQILVTFLERPAAKWRPIIDLVNELSTSQTCGWDPSWNQGQKVCLHSYTAVNWVIT